MDLNSFIPHILLVTIISTPIMALGIPSNTGSLQRGYSHSSISNHQRASKSPIQEKNYTAIFELGTNSSNFVPGFPVSRLGVGAPQDPDHSYHVASNLLREKR